jgi:hypothetical protein
MEKKKKSWKSFIIFWIVAILALSAWYGYLQVKNRNASFINPLVSLLPIGSDAQQEVKVAADIFTKISAQDSKERVFMILFQNNWEIRPGGGFIGSFGILKIKNGQVADLQIHDTGNFDARVPATVPAPYPMPETLRIKSLQLRDSNFSPDFITNAKAAENFYYLGQGQEKFDGIIAVNANVLISFLKVTGPVEIPGYPGTYGDENAILALEYQVEKAFEEQGITRGDRKSVMNDLAMEILKKVQTLDNSQKIELLKIISVDLKKKDIQMNFSDPELQAEVEKINWAGEIDENWKQDYLMANDANLGAYKSDYYVKRSMDYSIDLTGENPRALLEISYEHTAKQKDWMTKDYVTYLRVYVPDGSWLVKQNTTAKPVFGSEFGKKYFGMLVYVPLGQTRVVEMEYNLPKEMKNLAYDLEIQKQSGINGVPVKVHVIDKDGFKSDYDLMLNSDFTLSGLTR